MDSIVILDQSLSSYSEWNICTLGPPDYPPIRWTEAGLDQAAIVAAIQAGWLMIPDTIRARLATSRVWSKPPLHFVVGSSNSGRIENLGSVASYGGIYYGGIWLPPSFTRQTVVHELGHHAGFICDMDDTSTSVGKPVNPSIALYAAIQPHIYVGMYCKTNMYEWHAESWASMLGAGIVSVVGVSPATAKEWYILHGFSQEWAVTSRMIWLANYPDLPAYLGGVFDTIPSSGVPVVASTAMAWTQLATKKTATDNLVVGDVYSIVGDDATAIFTGYPWPTFSWEININGAWTSLADTGPCIISTTPLLSTCTSVAWRVTATNANGSATSTTPTYQVLSRPVTTLDPVGGEYTEGDTITLTAAATGATSQQWRISSGGGDIPGATGTTLTVTAGSGQFTVGSRYVYCRFTNAAGVTDTNMAQITITAAPVTPTIASVSPTSGRYDQSNTVVITGTNLTGATAVTIGSSYEGFTPVDSFTVDSSTQITAQTAIMTAAQAYAVLTKGVNVTTPAGTGVLATSFTFFGPPRFATSPNTAAQSKAVGVSLFLNTSVQGATSYQWQRKLTGDSTWTDIPGRIYSSLTSPSSYVLLAADGYASGQTWQFRNTATNAYGTVYSNPSGIITIT